MKARIRELIRAVPFQPFIVRMADGREYRVDHPDFVFASPSNQSWIFIEDPETERLHQLSGLLITSIEQAPDTSLAT